VGNQARIDVSLVEEYTKLDEVVVIGYGQMKRSDLTGSVVSVTSDEISKTVSTTFEQVLQGKAAGVEVTQNTGQPGGSVSVRIRGVNSLMGNNEPLYVIDGIPVEGYTGDISYNNSIGNVLSTINPSDIVDMQILKDASATAIYGSKAANGVILIATRQGEAGEAKISYDAYYGIRQLPTYIETMNLRELPNIVMRKTR
jgi:TonB-dependent SusC/RagA subfamily outer membrane receptor